MGTQLQEKEKEIEKLRENRSKAKKYIQKQKEAVNFRFSSLELCFFRESQKNEEKFKETLALCTNTKDEAVASSEKAKKMQKILEGELETVQQEKQDLL